MEQIKKLYDWLDNRTGIRDHIRETLFENVQEVLGGAMFGEVH